VETTERKRVRERTTETKVASNPVWFGQRLIVFFGVGEKGIPNRNETKLDRENITNRCNKMSIPITCVLIVGLSYWNCVGCVGGGEERENERKTVLWEDDVGAVWHVPFRSRFYSKSTRHVTIRRQGRRGRRVVCGTHMTTTHNRTTTTTTTTTTVFSEKTNRTPLFF
jgi:hypothetical protein